MPDGIDTSFYTRAPAGGFNPLSFATQAQQLQGLVNQNRLFPLVQQQNQQAVQKGALDIQQSQLELARQHNATMLQNMSALVNDPNFSPDLARQRTTEWVQQGLITPQQAATELSDLAGQSDQSPGALRQYAITRYIVPQLQAQQQLDAIAGAPMVTNTGGQTQVGTFSPINGYRSAGAFPNTMTPGENASRIPTFQNGQPGSVPQSAIATPTGQPQPQGVIPQGSPSGAPISASPLSPPGAGAPSASGLTAPNGFIPSGPKLGQEAAANSAGSASGQSLANAYQNAAGYQTRMFQLNQALKGLQGAGNTGPGTETRQQLVSFAQSLPFLGSAAKAVGISNPSEIANYDLANKYLTQYAIAQAGALGQGTDEKLAVTLSGNASTHISNLAAQDVVKANMALERMRQAGIMAFQKSNLPPDQFNGFMANWGNSADARAFALPELDGGERKKLLASLAKAPPKAKQSFADSYNAGVSAGLVPDLAPAQ